MESSSTETRIAENNLRRARLQTDFGEESRISTNFWLEGGQNLSFETNIEYILLDSANEIATKKKLIFIFLI